MLSRAKIGLAAPQVHVEVHLAAGLPSFTLVGLPAPVVRESRERVRAAIVNSGFELPAGRVTVNLAPVELAKEGGRFDLPIAIGVRLAANQTRNVLPCPVECYGELGLSGELKPRRRPASGRAAGGAPAIGWRCHARISSMWRWRAPRTPSAAAAFVKCARRWPAG